MPLFVVHEHWASHHHFDLRLEEQGVLKSWAVPKSPPLRAGIKRLAVQVENHAKSYARFEGEIPEGHYGAGKVKIWDKGTFKGLERSTAKWHVVLKGKKLKGEYILVLFRKPKSWLFFKK